MAEMMAVVYVIICFKLNSTIKVFEDGQCSYYLELLSRNWVAVTSSVKSLNFVHGSFTSTTMWSQLWYNCTHLRVIRSAAMYHGMHIQMNRRGYVKVPSCWRVLEALFVWKITSLLWDFRWLSSHRQKLRGCYCTQKCQIAFKKTQLMTMISVPCSNIRPRSKYSACTESQSYVSKCLVREYDAGCPSWHDDRPRARIRKWINR